MTLAAPSCSARRSLKIAIGALLTMSGVALYAAIAISRNAGQLERESVVTQATVVSKQERRRARYVAGYRTSHVGYHLSVTYRYSVDGQRMEGTHGVERDQFDALQVGQSVPVRYAAANPHVSEIDLGWTGRNGVWAGAVSIGFGLMAGGLLFLLWRMPKPALAP